MRPVLPKRFYKEVGIGSEGDGFAILLDGRKVKTPAKNPFLVPTEAAAERVALEWREQAERIDPAKMPATRLVNTAIDGIANDTQAVLEDIVRFVSNDLLFYRASHPDTLVDLQRKHWDAILDRIEAETGAIFEIAVGISHVAQPREAVAAVGTRLSAHHEPIRLACLHTATTLTGSGLIAVALAEGWLDLESAWNAAHVDEDYNISQWGEDFEAAKRRTSRLVEMRAAHDLFRTL